MENENFADEYNIDVMIVDNEKKRKLILSTEILINQQIYYLFLL